MGTRSPQFFYAPRQPFGSPHGPAWRAGALQRSPSGAILKPLTAQDLAWCGGVTPPRMSRSPSLAKGTVVLKPIASASDLGGSPQSGRSNFNALKSYRTDLERMYNLQRSPPRSTRKFGGNEPFNPSFYPGRSITTLSTRG